MEDKEYRHDLAMKARIPGFILMTTAVLGAMDSALAEGAPALAACGGALYVGSYLAECARYLKCHCNQRHERSEHTPSNIEDKL